MRFYHIWHKNSIAWSLIEDLTGLFSAPTTKVLEKKWTKYLLFFYVHFQRLFVCRTLNLTKVWPKILIFTVTAKCWREGCFCPPPPPFTPRCD